MAQIEDVQNKDVLRLAYLIVSNLGYADDEDDAIAAMNSLIALTPDEADRTVLQERVDDWQAAIDGYLDLVPEDIATDGSIAITIVKNWDAWEADAQEANGPDVNPEGEDERPEEDE